MGTDVVALKVSTGEEILGRVEYSDAQSLSLSKVRVVMIQPMPDKQIGIQFMPFLASNPDATIPIYKNNIVSEVRPSADIEKIYLQQTTTIQLMG